MGLIIDAIAYAVTRAQERAALKTNDSTHIYSTKNPIPWFSTMIAGEKNTLTNPYKQLGIVYTCITRKARNIAGVPFNITRQGSSKVLGDQYPIVQLIKNPNPLMTFEDLIQALVVSLDTAGEWFVWPDDNKAQGFPLAFWFINASKVIARPNGWEIKFDNEKRTLPFEEVAQGRYIDLDNLRRGLSPLSIIGKMGAVRYNAIAYTESFFENDATPTVTYETDKYMSPTQVAEFEQHLEKRRGQKGWHKEMTLWNGLKANALAISNKDMQILEILGLTTDELLGVFGVPKSEIYGQANTYATANVEDRAFWKKTLIPIMRFGIEPALNKVILNPLGYDGHFDINSIDALNEELLDKADAANKFYIMGVPFNMINARLNLGFEDVPGGDEPRQNAPALPVADPNATSNDNQPVKQVKQLMSPEEVNKALRDAEWKKQNDSIQSIETGAARAAKKYFSEVRRKWLKIATDETYTKIFDQFKIKSDVLPSLDDLLKDLSDEKLRKYIKKYAELALQKGIDSIGSTDKVMFTMSDDKAIYALTRRLDKITRINDTLRGDLKDLFVDLASDKQQMSESELAKYLRDGTEHIIDMADGRARTIARTEMHGAYGDGRWEAAKDTDPIGKEWIDSRDSDVRESHQIDGETQMFNDPFSNGLGYPGDPDGDAGEVCNCRCKFRCIYDKGEM